MKSPPEDLEAFLIASCGQILTWPRIRISQPQSPRPRILKPCPHFFSDLVAWKQKAQAEKSPKLLKPNRPGGPSIVQTRDRPSSWRPRGILGLRFFIAGGGGGAARKPAEEGWQMLPVWTAACVCPNLQEHHLAFLQTWTGKPPRKDDFGGAHAFSLEAWGASNPGVKGFDFRLRGLRGH